MYNIKHSALSSQQSIFYSMTAEWVIKKQDEKNIYNIKSSYQSVFTIGF